MTEHRVGVQVQERPCDVTSSWCASAREDLVTEHQVGVQLQEKIV